MSDAPILLVGSPRSGTTLLRDLLRSHSRLTLPVESGVLPRLWRAHGDPRDERAARRLAADLLSTVGVRRWATGATVASLGGHRTFAAMTAALYERWAAAEGKPRWGDKTPLYAAELPAMDRIFPGALVVHIIRDGRDAVASHRRQPWGPAGALAAAELWRDTVRCGRTDGAALGARYLEIRYEDLVRSPEDTLRTVCAHVGEDFEPAMLHPTRIPPPGGRPPPWTPDQAGGIDARAIGAWHRQLDADDVAVVAGVAGDLLDELGYGPAGPGRTVGRRERARTLARDRARWARWRATTWDRGPRLREDLVLARAALRGARA